MHRHWAFRKNAVSPPELVQPPALSCHPVAARWSGRCSKHHRRDMLGNKAFREKPGSQIFAKRSAPLNRCTRSAFHLMHQRKAERFRQRACRMARIGTEPAVFFPCRRQHGIRSGGDRSRDHWRQVNPEEGPRRIANGVDHAMHHGVQFRQQHEIFPAKRQDAHPGVNPQQPRHPVQGQPGTGNHPARFVPVPCIAPGDIWPKMISPSITLAMLAESGVPGDLPGRALIVGSTSTGWGRSPQVQFALSRCKTG